MNLLTNLSIRFKLMILVGIATLALVYYSSTQLINATRIASDAETTEALVEINIANASLVHELQKERGMTAGYIGSNGSNFADKLPSQRELTDQTVAQRREVLQELRGYIEDKKIRDALQQIQARLERLNRIRDRVRALDIPLAEAIDFYSDTNSMLLDMTPHIARETNDAESSRRLQSYYTFLLSKERAGIERAVLSATFGADRFTSSSMLLKFLSLVTEQIVYLGIFEQLAGANELQFYQAASQDASIAGVERFRSVARDNSSQGGFGADANEWFSVATQRINKLKDVENSLASAILNNARQQLEWATTHLRLLGALSAAIILLTIGLGIWLIVTITRQADNLATTLSKASSDKDLSVRARISSRDELGHTGSCLNAMFENFSAAIEEIGKASDHLASAAEETSATIVESNRNLNTQREQTEMVVAATEEMSATAGEVARNITTAADAASRAVSTTELGSNLVRDNVSRIRKLAEDVKYVGSMIDQLNASSANIVKVIEVIKSVAEQTNLLALNAAIEAARAGEQGRGFAVVADEVRTLAQRTQSSTSEIENIISSFNAQLEGAVGAIRNGSELAKNTAEQTNGLEEALANISGEIYAISNMATQVAAAAEEQVATTAEISRNMETISSMTQATAASSDQINSVAREQAHLASNLQAIATAFKT